MDGLYQKLEQAGFKSYGLEQDYIAISVGTHMYVFKQEQIINSDMVSYLKKISATFDVVSLLNVLHHYELSNDSLKIDEIIRTIDKLTKFFFLKIVKVMKKLLKENYQNGQMSLLLIGSIINTTFKSIISLGRDDDFIPPFEGYYNRTLFACSR